MSSHMMIPCDLYDQVDEGSTHLQQEVTLHAIPTEVTTVPHDGQASTEAAAPHVGREATETERTQLASVDDARMSCPPMRSESTVFGYTGGAVALGGVINQ